MLDSDGYSPQLVARLQDFLGDRTPWQRRLWMAGTLARLREAEEAIRLSGTPTGLRKSSVEQAQASARNLAVNDPGLGSQKERSRLAKLLSADIEPGSEEHHRLREIIDWAAGDYLGRWSAAVAASPPRVEFAARVVAAHLLDGGSSPGHLYRWLDKLGHENTSYGFAEIASLARDQVVERDFEVLVPVLASPPLDVMPSTWRSAPDLGVWLQQHLSSPPTAIDDVAIGDLAGGFLMTCRARDAGAAASAAADIVDTYHSRIQIGSKHAPLVPASVVFVAGSQKPLALRPQRGVEIRALEREDQLFSPPQGLAIDSALELVALLDRGSPAAAIAGAWAAVESLLKAPGDGGAHRVAPRLAALVTCSFVRAELTTLAWRKIRQPGKDASAKALAAHLRALEDNGPRATHVAELLLNGQSLDLPQLTDTAAEQRVLKLLQSPKKGLGEITTLTEDALTRLYRQRNLVLHAGRTDAVALRPSLRTSTSLVGAALDRIAHAWFVNGVEPLRLAALARLRLERLETPEAPRLTELLD